MSRTGIEKQADLTHRVSKCPVGNPVEQGLPAASLKLHHAAQQRGLARSSTAEHSSHLAGTHVEADRVENSPASPAYRQVDGLDHARRLLDV
jgi:hypothetical protein